jgi:serine/threonine protein kinase
MKNIIGPLYKYKLVSKEVTDTIDLMELLRHSDKDSLLARKRQIISKVAKAVKEMHDAGIYHADLHLKNILVQSGEDGTINVYIIDLDKSRQFEEIDLNKRRKNILRLDRSLEKFNRNASDRKDLLVTNTDKMRFLREYIRTDSESRETLKSYLRTYLTTHKLHRFWWLVVNGGR